MNVQETLQIIHALKDCGATHFKSQDFEINMSTAALCEQRPIPPLAVEIAQPQPPVVSPTVENKESVEKINGLIKTLQLSPEELLDVVMPAGAGG